MLGLKLNHVSKRGHWCLLEGDEHIQRGVVKFSHKYSQKSPHKGEVWVVFHGSSIRWIFYLSSCNYLCNILQYWTALQRHSTELWKHILHHNINHYCNMSSGMPAHNNKVYVHVNILSFSCTLDTAHHQYTLKKLQSNISYKSHLSRQWNCW